MKRRVVVTGLGVVTSIGHNVASFWSSLLAGRIGIDRVTFSLTDGAVDTVYWTA